MKKINVAIDGFSATGKGSTSKFLAKELGYHYLDSGALYRGITLFLDKKEIKPDDMSKTDIVNINLEFGKNNHLYINGEDKEFEIRSEYISRLTPKYSKEKIIRDNVNQQLKELVKEKGFIAEGRDIATKIMPHAEIKLFLVGDSYIRAKRRQEQLKIKGILENVEDVKKELEARDLADMTREHDPMIKHREAIEIDTSHLSMEEQNLFILGIIKKYIENN